MQCRDGGWAALTSNNNKQALAHVLFAEFMSLLDPTCADVTAHVVEFLSEVPRGHSQEQIAFDQALRFLLPEPGGRWSLVWALGGKLPVWHGPDPGCSAGSRRRYAARI